MSLCSPPISLVYSTAELIGVDVYAHEHSFIYVFMNDLCCFAVLQKYEVLTAAILVKINWQMFFFFTYDKLVRLISYQTLGGVISEYFRQNRAV